MNLMAWSGMYGDGLLKHVGLRNSISYFLHGADLLTSFSKSSRVYEISRIWKLLFNNSTLLILLKVLTSASLSSDKQEVTLKRYRPGPILIRGDIENGDRVLWS